jgi:hypothetical protein
MCTIIFIGCKHIIAKFFMLDADMLLLLILGQILQLRLDSSFRMLESIQFDLPLLCFSFLGQEC